MSSYDARPGSRRSPSALSSTGVLAIVATVLAVAIGFVVLRRIDREAGTVTSLGNGSTSQVGAGGGPAPTPSGTTPAGEPTPTTAVGVPATTLPPTTFAGATVIVANANGGSGTAGKVSTVLESATDFTMGDPTDANKKDLTTSLVYYEPNAVLAAQPVAENLARMLGGLAVLPLPPDAVGNLNGAGVVLMLGTDLVNVTVAELKPPLRAADATAAATATLPAGGTTTTTTQ